MPEQNKRIIVEGVSYAQLFYFPRLFRAVTAALQPGRMVIGLLMITALITFGQLWDSVVAKSAVAPDGLTAGRWDEDVHGPVHQAHLRNAAISFTNLTPGPNERLETETVLDAMAAEYEDRRAQHTTEEAQKAFDAAVAQAVDDIRASRPRRVYEATEAHIVANVRAIVESTLALSITGVRDGLQQLLIAMPRLLWKNHTIFTIVYGILAIIVFAIGGGAIARMAAVQIGCQERLGIREALDFSLRRLGAMVMAQALPLLILLFVCGAIMVIGVLMAAPVLDVVGGLIYGLALLLGFLVAFLIIGFIAGHPMLVPAAAVENCSGADAMQRAYAYTVTRPLHLLAYWALAIIGFTLGFILVSAVALLMLNGTASLFGTLHNNPAMTMAGGHALLDFERASPALPFAQWHHRWAGGLIGFWETVVICLVAAYVVSYYFSAATIGYLLMRRAADGQDIEEAWRPGLVPGTMAPAPGNAAPSA